MARLLAQNVAEGRLTAPLLLNVNLPNLPPERIRGVSLTRLGRRTYMDVVNEGDDGRRKYYWIARDRPGGCWSEASTSGLCAAAASR